MRNAISEYMKLEEHELLSIIPRSYKKKVYLKCIILEIANRVLQVCDRPIMCCYAGVRYILPIQLALPDLECYVIYVIPSEISDAIVIDKLSKFVKIIGIRWQHYKQIKCKVCNCRRLLYLEKIKSIAQILSSIGIQFSYCVIRNYTKVRVAKRSID